MTVKVRLAAPSAIAAVLMALSAYGIHVDVAIHRLIDDAMGRQTDSKPIPPALADYDSRLAPIYTALDSDLASPAPTAASGTMRLTLAVADGETLAGVLAAADVPADQARAAIDATRGLYDPKKLRAGQFVTVDFDGADGPFRGFEVQTDNDRRLTVSRGKDAFVAQQTKLALKTETRAARGVIRNSLSDSAAEAGIPYSVSAAMIRAFSFDVDFQRDIQPGDRFEIMYDTLVGEGGGHPGDLLFAELTLSGKRHTIYGLHRDEGPVEFYTADGKSIRSALLRTPVDGARLSSGYGMRLHPILGFTRMHKGVDFAVPTGTPIYAAGDGVIEQSGWWGTYGRYVRIKHNGQTATAYAHLSRIAGAMNAGQHVHQGQVIGYVGMTGNATGPHLHYEVIKNGREVNPITVTLPANTGLEGEALVAFRKTIGEREQRFAALLNGAQFAAAHAP